MNDLFGLCPYECSGVDWAFFIVLTVCILGIAAVVIFLLYNLIDEKFATENISDAEVIGKAQEYEPGSNTMVGTNVGSVTVLNSIRSPGQMNYKVVAKITDPEATIDGEVIEATMRLRDFVRVNKGDQIRVSWGVGVLSGKWFIDSAYLGKQ